MTWICSSCGEESKIATLDDDDAGVVCEVWHKKDGKLTGALAADEVTGEYGSAKLLKKMLRLAETNPELLCCLECDAVGTISEKEPEPSPRPEPPHPHPTPHPTPIPIPLPPITSGEEDSREAALKRLKALEQTKEMEKAMTSKPVPTPGPHSGKQGEPVKPGSHGPAIVPPKP